MPREVFEIIELTLHLVHAPLQDLNTSLGRVADVAPVQIYAARHGLKAPLPVTASALASLRGVLRDAADR